MWALPRWRRLDDYHGAATAAIVLRIAAVAGVLSLALTAFVQFDSNPLDLRSPKVESVSTLFDLMKNPQTSPNTIDVPAPSLTRRDALAQRYRQAAAGGAGAHPVQLRARRSDRQSWR